MEELEQMSDFFTSRVEDYDEHMLHGVEGCKEGYIKMASLVPQNCKTLLDLGCGTGLELDRIFEVLPDVAVTGIDITKAMLDKLRDKHSDKKLSLICGDYFAVDFESKKYDCAISFQTMHHFGHKKKIGLYKKIHNSLKSGGVYIECDYMVETQDEEDHWFKENNRKEKSRGYLMLNFIITTHHALLKIRLKC